MELRDNALKDLRAIIEDAAKAEMPSAGSEARKIGDLYASFMDEKKVEELGLEPIQGDLARIDAVEGQGGLPPPAGRAAAPGDPAGCSGCSSPPTPSSRTRRSSTCRRAGSACRTSRYYRDPKFQPIREAFVAHVERMFALAGRPDPAAAAKQVMDLETRLAKNHWDRVKSRDQTLTYNKKDRAALDALTPGFDWATYFDATGAKDLPEVIVRQPDYFAAMAAVV